MVDALEAAPWGRTPEAYLASAAVFAGSSPGGPSSAAWETLLRTAVLVLMVALIHLVWLLGGASLGCVLPT